MDVEIQGFEEVQARLDGLSRVIQKRIYRRIGRKIASNSKKRVTQQKDLTGASFTPRSESTPKKKRRKKMLAGLKKKIQVFNVSDKGVEIGFRSRKLQRFAARHQYGFTQKFTKAIFAKRKPPTGGATRGQAKALREAGYKIRKGKGYKRPSIKYIVETLSFKQAGFILSTLIPKKPTKSTWSAKTPARSFVGVTALELQEILTIVDSEIERNLNRE